MHPTDTQSYIERAGAKMSQAPIKISFTFAFIGTLAFPLLSSADTNSNSVRCTVVRNICAAGHHDCEEDRAALRKDGINCAIDESIVDTSRATSKDVDDTERCSSVRAACDAGNPRCYGLRTWLRIDGITCQDFSVAASNAVSTISQHAPPQDGSNGGETARWHENTGGGDVIPLLRDGGTYLVAVVINNRITLNFTLDTGASDVTIPGDVVSTLIRMGTITQSDRLDRMTYTLADGTQRQQTRVRINSLRVGNVRLNNITAAVGPAQGSLLLGQSFLRQFNSWSIDNQTPALRFR